MRYALSLLLLPALLSVALAQDNDNDAEKLFRAMEKKIKAAKAFEVTFSYDLNKRKAQGALLLTNDNKARLKVKGHFGEKRNAAFELVADGKRLKTKGARFFVASNGQPGMELGGQSEWVTPENFHDVLGATVTRGGVWFTILGLPYLQREKVEPDAEGSRMHAYGFKPSAAEKVGEREAKVVHYRFGKGGACPDDAELTVWIDAETNLPLKRLLVLPRGDRVRVTETYKEFKLNPTVDVKAFELPK